MSSFACMSLIKSQQGLPKIRVSLTFFSCVSTKYLLSKFSSITRPPLIAPSLRFWPNVWLSRELFLTTYLSVPIEALNQNDFYKKCKDVRGSQKGLIL